MLYEQWSKTPDGDYMGCDRDYAGIIEGPTVRATRLCITSFDHGLYPAAPNSPK